MVCITPGGDLKYAQRHRLCVGLILFSGICRALTYSKLILGGVCLVCVRQCDWLFTLLPIAYVCTIGRGCISHKLNRCLVCGQTVRMKCLISAAPK